MTQDTPPTPDVSPFAADAIVNVTALDKHDETMEMMAKISKGDWSINAALKTFGLLMFNKE
jgi:hypothetical protein